MELKRKKEENVLCVCVYIYINNDSLLKNMHWSQIKNKAVSVPDLVFVIVFSGSFDNDLSVFDLVCVGVSTPLLKLNVTFLG